MAFKFNPLTGNIEQVGVNQVTTTSEVQTLSLVNNTLSISSGNSVDLSGYVDAATIEQTISNTTVIQNIQDGSAFQLPGPYTNEGNAAAAGVQIGEMYYDNGGTVRVRLS